MGLGFVNVPGSGGGGEGGILALDRIYISKQPTKTDYKAGEVFNPSGMIVKADYSLGGIVIVEGKEITGYTYPTTPLAVGTKTVTISLTEGGNTRTADVTVTVTKTVVPVPTFTDKLYYNANTQTFRFNNEPGGGVATKTGQTSGLAAGSYTTHFELNNTELCEWADKSFNGDVTCTILKVTPTVTAPTKAADMTYNGNSRDLTATAGSTNFGILQYSMDNGSWSTTRPTATNAGSYPVYYRVVGDTNINDVGSVNIGTVKIDQKATTLSASSGSVTLDKDHLTANVTITSDGDGTFQTPTSSDSGVATATISNKVVTISNVNKASGTATITVNQNAGTNYKAASVKINVTASFISNTLNDNDWATIGDVSKSGQGDLYWDVGDCKAGTFNGKVGDYLTLSGTKYTYIIDFNHVDGGVADNNIMWATFMSAPSGGVPTALVDSKYSPDAGWAGYTSGEKAFTMNHWGNYNYGGWAGCDLRYDIMGATNKQPSDYGKAKTTSCVGYDADGTEFTSPKANTLLAAFPADLRANMRLREHWADSKGNSSNVEANVTKIKDAISLIMEFELFGARTYANQYEKNKQTQFTYWKNANTKKFMKDGNVSTEAQCVWLGSARYSDASSFCGSSGGSPISGGAYYSLALVAAFKT